MLDAYVAAGGNVIDTGWVYGARQARGRFSASGNGARRARGDRADQQGRAQPALLSRRDRQAARRNRSSGFKTDYVDVYFMHRDNLDVPVGEFVDAMDAEAKAGRIRGIFGGSNWTRERMDEAIAYAKRTGKIGARRALQQFHAGRDARSRCGRALLSAVIDSEWRDVADGAQIPNFSWSSQARGFFTDRAGTATSATMPRWCDAWYSDGEFRAARSGDRARQSSSARRRSRWRSPTCMAQPFPSIPLIGPRRAAASSRNRSARVELQPDARAGALARGLSADGLGRGVRQRRRRAAGCARLLRAVGARCRGVPCATLAEAGRADLGVAYGPDARQRLDLFRPEGTPRGLVVFVHGGYWQILRWLVVVAFCGGRAGARISPLPSRPIGSCPEVRITDIGERCGGGGDAGPQGRSAARSISAGIRPAVTWWRGSPRRRRPCRRRCATRLRNIVPISGLHDLRPLMRTAMNRALRHRPNEERRESPALLEPLDGVKRHGVGRRATSGPS